MTRGADAPSDFDQLRLRATHVYYLMYEYFKKVAQLRRLGLIAKMKCYDLVGGNMVLQSLIPILLTPGLAPMLSHFLRSHVLLWGTSLLRKPWML